jgi:hypothetical protein
MASRVVGDLKAMQELYRISWPLLPPFKEPITIVLRGVMTRECLGPDECLRLGLPMVGTLYLPFATTFGDKIRIDREIDSPGFNAQKSLSGRRRMT